MEPKKEFNFQGYSIRYTLPRSQIMAFVGELHNMQMDMIEEAVERSGYKDAKEVLAHIMSK
jgi:hypothetical protein